MRSATKAVISVAVVLVMTVTCICVTPSSSSDSYNDGKHYGVADTKSYDQLDDAIHTLSGKHITELIDEFFHDYIASYNLDQINPNINGGISARRDISVSGDVCTYEDYWSGFLETHLDLVISGNYPAEGKYFPQEGETTLEMLTRIFGNEGAGERSTELHTDFRIYFDMMLTSYVDTESGNLTDADLEIKLLVKDKENNTIQIMVEKDEEGNPESATVTYDQVDIDSMFYCDFEVSFDMTNMTVVSDFPDWRVTTTAGEHVQKSIISSDLADSLWLDVIAASNGTMDSKLPNLILEILGSGGRMLDLFDTIKSLTSSDVPDLSFSMLFNGHDYTDDHGNTYSKLVPPKKDDKTQDDDTRPPLYFPKGGYELDLAQYVKYIPDAILDPDYKEAATYILIALGLGNDDNDPHIFSAVNVSDLEGRDYDRMQSDLIRSYVSENFSTVERESYSTPEVYQYIAWTGLALTVIIIVLMWRRYI